jgi:flagellar protein FlaJ
MAAVSEYLDVKLSEQILKKLEESERRTKFKQFLKTPMEVIRDEPAYTAFISVPLAIAILIYGLIHLLNSPIIDDVVIASALIAIAPPGFMHYFKQRHIRKMEEYLPSFLRELSESNRTGMTLPQALKTVAKGTYGALTAEIKRMDALVSWGLPFEEALENFAKRVRTPLVGRAAALIVQANRAGGNVPDVLEAASKDAQELQMMHADRYAGMVIYLVICYVAFFVFIFVIAVLATTFIPVMYEAGTAAAQSGQQISGFYMVFNPEEYKRLFFHAAVIQGFVSGLVAGQMGEGSVSAGLKHSVILTVIAWVVFTFFV